MNKREQIEKALGRYGWLAPDVDEGCLVAIVDVDALVDEAIVIEDRVVHCLVGDDEYTGLQDREGVFEPRWICWGHHGIPGEYTFIGLPLEKKDG